MKKYLYLIGFLGYSIHAQVGINTTSPTETLHVNGTFRIENGSEGANRVLVSDSNGVATWSEASIDAAIGVLGSGVNVSSSTSNGDYLQTNSSITLPPGKYAVYVTMLMTTGGASNTPVIGQYWLRTTFSDSNTPNPTTSISPDIEGSQLISGSLPGRTAYAMLTGFILINNTSGADKTYYYVAGSPEVYNAGYGGSYSSMSSFGGTSWGENNIIAYRIQN